MSPTLVARMVFFGSASPDETPDRTFNGESEQNFFRELPEREQDVIVAGLLRRLENTAEGCSFLIVGFARSWMRPNTKDQLRSRTK